MQWAGDVRPSVEKIKYSSDATPWETRARFAEDGPLRRATGAEGRQQGRKPAHLTTMFRV